MFQPKRFLLNSDECELLLEFEAVPHLAQLATHLGRDHSVIARNLRQISEKYPLVEKKAGRWILTDKGRALNESTRLALDAQAAALQTQKTLRIGTNREFASRILCASYQKFQDLFPKSLLTLNSYQEGVEAALLKSQIDIGIDCERPNDPEISYRLVVEEEIIAVGAPAFIKKNKKEITAGHYQTLPHLLCDRLHPERIFSSSRSRTQVIAQFNDIAATRAACLQAVGWALLPSYSVKEEIKKGSLVRIDEESFGKSKYGVWWLRNRPHMKESAEKVVGWLRQQEL